MKKEKLLYLVGKPVKFARFGGLSPVPQKGYKLHAPTFHSPPARKGIYAFLWPYIDRFFLSNAACSGIAAKYSKFEYVKDRLGNRVTDTHPEFEKYSDKNKAWTVATARDEEGIPTSWALVTPKTLKIFVYTGVLWHHFGDEYLAPDKILARHGSWVKSEYRDYVCALKKNFHDMAKEPITTIEQRWKLSRNPTLFWAKDTLEVFIERI